MLLVISTAIAFLVTAAKGCPVGPSPPRENLSVSSLANVNIYRYYDLENKEYNMEFLLNAFKKLDDYPKCTLAKHMALVYTIPLLEHEYRLSDTQTLRSRVEEALKISKNTAVEDIVKFRVAYFLQLNALFYFNALFDRDNFERLKESLTDKDKNTLSELEKKGYLRTINRAIRIFRKAVTTGDVPMADVTNSAVALYMGFSGLTDDFISLNTEGYEVITLWEEMLLKHKNATEKIACEPDEDADEQHSVSDHQANGNSTKSLPLQRPLLTNQ